MKDNGFKIIWTVHNILPHDAMLQDCQIRLRVELVKRCDIIHTMCNDTIELSEAFLQFQKINCESSSSNVREFLP